MELSELATFAAVAKCGGITRAATQLNTVQSNVTARVQALEKEIGVPLFERHSRGVSLTPAGKRLLPYAERLASISREAIVAARDDGIAKGPLSIGAMETTAAVRLPPILARFHQSYPRVELSLQTAPTAALVQSVLDGRLDAAFVAGPIEHPDLVARTAFSEELVLITAPRWNSLSELREAKRATGLSILVFRTRCTYRQKLEEILSEMGWPCGPRLEMGTLDGILGCVAADMGVTLLPRAVSEKTNLKGSVRSHTLKSEQRRIDTLFIRHAHRHCSRALESLLDCLAWDRQHNSGSATAPRRGRTTLPRRGRTTFATG
jgi:DNA-binding transcriptional LysR family regulator